MPDITKSEQRKRAQAARKAIPDDLRREYDRAICQRIGEHPALKDARLVMSYMAFAGEVDLTQLHETLCDRGIEVCFPECCDEGVIQALLPRDEDCWEPGRYGILAPAAERSDLIEPCDIDLVLTPCVAFDESRMRLGWGGGYYDRFLPRCPQAYSIAAAYEVQRVEKVISDHPWDAVLDAVATELRWY
jgi:5-formyltetrahydrofolate cyclo-ligase